MNWKQFLKLDWRKLFLFCLISIILLDISKGANILDLIAIVFAIPVVIVIGSYLIEGGLLPLTNLKAFIVVFQFIIVIFYAILTFLFYLRYWNENWFYGIPLIVLLIPSFIISWSLIWIYDKSRKKSKK